MEYEKYYQNTEILFEMIKLMRGRETVWLSQERCIRNLKIHNLAYLRSNMNAFNFFKRRYNLYISLAEYNNMPLFSYDPKQRAKQRAEFNRDYMDYMIGYDFFMDFDGNPENLRSVYEEVKTLKEFFDENKITYSLIFSGSKGFHFWIPNKIFQNMDLDKRLYFYKDFVKKIRIIFELEHIDTTIYDYRRIHKLPYSLDVNSGLVALPLSDEQFNNFRKEDMKPEIVLEQNNIRNRGILLRNNNEESYKKTIRLFEEITR